MFQISIAKVGTSLIFNSIFQKFNFHREKFKNSFAVDFIKKRTAFYTYLFINVYCCELNKPAVYFPL